MVQEERPVIQTENLKKYFKLSRSSYLHAVDDISLKIYPGKTLGVVGESGCGKSTLGRTILHLISPTSGKVLFDGTDITNFSERRMNEMRTQMQIIFQDPYSSLNPRMTVEDLIAEYLIVNHICKSKRERTKRVEELMDMVGLDRRLADAYPHELDGGRRQRIGVARALALSPRFIVCDEPVSALDVSIQAQILNLLMDLQEQLGLAYMFITHDLSVVKHISNEIMVMYLGQCVEYAESDQLFAHPAHPYARQLDRSCGNVVADSLRALSGTERARIPVHIALDTGMHRVGLDPEDVASIEQMYRLENLRVTGIFTHLCVADSSDTESIHFTEQQIRKYHRAIQSLRTEGVAVSGTHVQNSYAVVNYNPQPCDYARLGILLYGVTESGADYLSRPMDLQPVLSLRTHITSIREIGPGETVSYGRVFCAARPTRIASVAIGYADGIPRNLSGKMRAIVRGKYVQQVGRICMDQMMLDVTEVPEAQFGDIATLIGADGSSQIPAVELAQQSGTITNELLSRLGARIENYGLVGGNV